MKRTEIDAIVALAGFLCILSGTIYIFGFGAALVVLGFVLMTLSVTKLTRSVVLTHEQKEVAIISFPRVSREQAYTAYAEQLITCEREGRIARRPDTWKRDLKSAFRTYVVNFHTIAGAVKTTYRGIYNRLQAIRLASDPMAALRNSRKPRPPSRGEKQ